MGILVQGKSSNAAKVRASSPDKLKDGGLMTFVPQQGQEALWLESIFTLSSSKSHDGHLIMCMIKRHPLISVHHSEAL